MFFASEFSLVVFVLTAISFVASIYLNYKSKQDSKQSEDYLDYMSLILAKEGRSTPYLEKIKAEFSKKNNAINVDNLLLDAEKAYKFGNNNVDSLNYYLTVKFLVYIKYKIHRKWIINERAYLNDLENVARLAVKKKKKSMELLLQLAMILDYQKKFQEARKYYFEAGKYSKTEFWRVPLSVSYGMSNEFDESLKQIRLLIRSGANNPLIFIHAAQAHVGLGNYPAAIRHLKIAKILGGNPYLINEGLVNAYLLNLQYFRTMYYSIIMFWLSLFNYSMKGSLMFVLRFFLALLLSLYMLLAKVTIGVGSKLWYIKRLKNPLFRLDIIEFSKGLDFLKFKLYKSAIKNYKKAISKMPRRSDNYRYLGISYLIQNNPERALETFEHAIENGIADNRLLQLYNDIKAYGETMSKGGKVMEFRIEIP